MAIRAPLFQEAVKIALAGQSIEPYRLYRRMWTSEDVLQLFVLPNIKCCTRIVVVGVWVLLYIEGLSTSTLSFAIGIVKGEFTG